MTTRRKLTPWICPRCRTRSLGPWCARCFAEAPALRLEALAASVPPEVSHG